MSSPPGDAASHHAREAPPPPLTGSGDPLRIVLLGRTGTGRSSSGNTILGQPVFRVDVSPGSVTSRCQVKTSVVGGRTVSVVDTPGFFHTRLSPEELIEEVGRCVALCSPGPHAFLFTLQPGRFTQEERDAFRLMEAVFGPEALARTVVLFTCGDRLRGTTVGDFLQQSGELSALVGSCGGGHHLFDNSGRRDEELAGGATSPLQVEELLGKIDEMLGGHGGGCYSDETFQEAQRALRDAQGRILGDRAAVGGVRGGEEEEEEEEEETRRRAERLFWMELLTAVGRGAAEGAGILGQDGGKGKVASKVKVVERAAALAASPLSIRSAAKAVGGAVREGGKVLFKHRKTFLK